MIITIMRNLDGFELFDLYVWPMHSFHIAAIVICAFVIPPIIARCAEKICWSHDVYNDLYVRDLLQWCNISFNYDFRFHMNQMWRKSI